MGVEAGVQLMGWRSRTLYCVWMCPRCLGHTSCVPLEVLKYLAIQLIAHEAREANSQLSKWVTDVKPSVGQPSQSRHL